MSLPGFSVRHVVLVNLIFILCMVAGVQVARRVPVDLYPDISFNTALVITVWPGASPSEVERLVTREIEDEIEGISGIKELRSYSSYGSSEIEITWKETQSDLEYQAALNDLRAAIDRAEELPENAETPILRELSVSESFNICRVSIADRGGAGEFTLREVARDLRDRLERVPGLRKADLRGGREREIRVLVDKYRAMQYDLTLAEISAVIKRNNQNFAGGSFTNPRNEEVTVRGLGQFRSSEELGRTVVVKNPDGSHVRLSDVADVVEGFEKRTMYGRYDGSPAVFLAISKDADADITAVVEGVREVVADYQSNLPEGVEVVVTWDTSRYVAARMDILSSSLALGVVLVVFVLWLTVGFRNAMLAIVGVPFSFLSALVLFPVFGITINSLSLVGFVMVSGMLVDDAIIILENIYRYIEDGVPLHEAAVKGAEEVMWPVIAAVATTVAAFIPMLTVSGTSGEFMSILPKTVIVCMLGSLLEALVVLPAHYIDFGSRTRPSESLGGRRAGPLARFALRNRVRVETALEALRGGFLEVQDRILEHRYAFLCVCLAALFFAAQLSRHVSLNLFPSDFTQLMISVDTPTEFGIERTDAAVRGVENALSDLRDELTDVSSYTGLSISPDESPVFGPNHGIIYLAFPNSAANMSDPQRILQLVRVRVDRYLEEQAPGVLTLRVFSPRQGPPIGKPVAIRIQSDDYAEAKQIAEEMKAELSSMTGVYNVEDNASLGPREFRVALDEHRASIHGLTFGDVGFALLAANDGAVSSTFKDPNSDEDIDIRVILREEQRQSIADLMDVDIRTPGGYLVKLGDVAEIEIERGFERLYHFDAERAVVVYADVDGTQATSVSTNEAMRARFKDVSLRFPGVNVIYGGEFQDTDAAFADLSSAFGIAALAIFGILAAQFRSYTQPLIVMSVIGFSFIGVTIGMYVMDYAFSMYVLYAIVGLAGIVVNDSLVLIDFVNRKRAQGATPREAVRNASAERFRPILLTTITTISGLAPMALGLTGFSPVFGPFATAIVFGLGAASLLTLFLVPTLYLGLEDFKARSKAFLRPTGRTLLPD